MYLEKLGVDNCVECFLQLKLVGDRQMAPKI